MQERRYNTPPSASELVYRIEAPRADRMPPVRPPVPEVDANTIEELFDLEADPDEHTNLAASPENADLRAQALEEFLARDGEFVHHLPAPRLAKAE